MPPAKPKPSEIAADAKKTYIPYIRENCLSWPTRSTLCYSESIIVDREMAHSTRFAFIDRDPVDAAIAWHEGHPDQIIPIPVILPANDKRPGGDWEAGVMSPEECLCRRSNLYATLTTPHVDNAAPSNYPIPSKAGVYSESVVVYRSGPPSYEMFAVMRALPIISVCPVKRPKLDSSGEKYSFEQEKELMRDKIINALRIAKWYKHVNLIIGTFGLGSGFRNPAEEVAKMWRDAFLKDPEFYNYFHNVVFAFEDPEGPSSSGSGSSSKSSSKSSKSSSSKSSSSKSSSKSGSSTAARDLDIFRDVFKPSKIHKS